MGYNRTIKSSVIIITLILGILTPLPLKAAQDQGSVLPRSLVKKYCFECHNKKKIKGDINLETALKTPPLVRHLDLWINVIERLKNHDMPPEEEPQPTKAERDRLLQWLDQEINQHSNTPSAFANALICFG